MFDKFVENVLVPARERIEKSSRGSVPRSAYVVTRPVELSTVSPNEAPPIPPRDAAAGAAAASTWRQNSGTAIRSGSGDRDRDRTGAAAGAGAGAASRANKEASKEAPTKAKDATPSPVAPKAASPPITRSPSKEGAAAAPAPPPPPTRPPPRPLPGTARPWEPANPSSMSPSSEWQREPTSSEAMEFDDVEDELEEREGGGTGASRVPRARVDVKRFDERSSDAGRHERDAQLSRDFDVLDEARAEFNVIRDAFNESQTWYWHRLNGTLERYQVKLTSRSINGDANRMRLKVEPPRAGAIAELHNLFRSIEETVAIEMMVQRKRGVCKLPMRWELLHFVQFVGGGVAEIEKTHRGHFSSSAELSSMDLLEFVTFTPSLSSAARVSASARQATSLARADAGSPSTGGLLSPSAVMDTESAALEALRQHADLMLDMMFLHHVQLSTDALAPFKQLLAQVCLCLLLCLRLCLLQCARGSLSISIGVHHRRAEASFRFVLILCRSRQRRRSSRISSRHTTIYAR